MQEVLYTREFNHNLYKKSIVSPITQFLYSVHSRNAYFPFSLLSMYFYLGGLDLYPRGYKNRSTHHQNGRPSQE